VKSNLIKRGFLALTVTQFFGAANDNILKTVLTFMVVDGAWQGDLGDGSQALVGICFTVPFILLSGYGGQLADRYSKSALSKIIKFAELPIALVAMAGFWADNLWITLFALIALTCQSAFFGPSKYGMIPELVEPGDLSRANGSINMMTNIAVIAGTLVAGLVSDAYSPQPESGETAVAEGAAVVGEAAVSEGAAVADKLVVAGEAAAAGLPWLPGVVLAVVAVLGIISVFFLGKLPVANKNPQKFDWNPFTTYIISIREMAKTRLLMVMMAWGYFYMLAGIALFIIPEYTRILSVTRFEASLLMGVMGIAIGIGCVLAGLISGHRIEPRLIPLGAFGLTLFFFLLAIQPTRTPENSLTGSAMAVLMSKESWFIFGAGISAGFYIIPLQALLQYLSPDDERGRFLGTANAVSFAFMTGSALIYRVVDPIFPDNPQQIFMVCAVLMLAGVSFFLYRLRGTGIMFGGGEALQRK